MRYRAPSVPGHLGGLREKVQRMSKHLDMRCTRVVDDWLAGYAASSRSKNER
jgi:hypothetical protein